MNHVTFRRFWMKAPSLWKGFLFLIDLPITKRQFSLAILLFICVPKFSVILPALLS